MSVMKYEFCVSPRPQAGRKPAGRGTSSTRDVTAVIVVGLANKEILTVPTPADPRLSRLTAPFESLFPSCSLAYSNADGKPWHLMAPSRTGRIGSPNSERATAICSPQGSGFESLFRSQV